MEDDRTPEEIFIGWNKACLSIAKRAMTDGHIPPEEEVAFMNFISDVYARLRQATWFYQHVKADNPNREQILSVMNGILTEVCFLDVTDVEPLKATMDKTDTLVSKLLDIPSVRKSYELEKKKEKDGFVMNIKDVLAVFPLFKPMDDINRAVLSGDTFSKELSSLLYSFEDKDLDIISNASDQEQNSSTFNVTGPIGSDENLSKTGEGSSQVGQNQPGIGGSSSVTPMDTNASLPSTFIEKIDDKPSKPSMKKGGKFDYNKNLTAMKARVDHAEKEYEKLKNESAARLKAFEDRALLEKIKEEKRINDEMEKMRKMLEIEQQRSRNIESQLSSGVADLSTPTTNKRVRVTSPESSTIGEGSGYKNEPGTKRKSTGQTGVTIEGLIDDTDIDMFLSLESVFGKEENYNKTLAETFKGVNQAMYDHFSSASTSNMPVDLKGPPPSKDQSLESSKQSEGGPSGHNDDAMDNEKDPPPSSNVKDGINDNARLNKLDGAITYENFLSGSLSTRSLLFNNFFSRFLRTTASVDFSRPVYHRYETSIAIQMLNIGKILTLAPEFSGNDVLRDTLTCIEIFMPKVPLNKYWQERPARRHCLRYISAIMATDITSLPTQWHEYLDNLFKPDQDREKHPASEKIVVKLKASKITTRKELTDAGLDVDFQDYPSPDPQDPDVRARIDLHNNNLDNIIDTKFQILVDFIDHAILKFKSTFIKLWTVLISRSFLMVCRRGHVTQYQAKKFTNALNIINPDMYNHVDYDLQMLSTMYNDAKNYIDENSALVFFTRISQYLGNRYSPVISNYVSYTRMNGMSALVIINTSIVDFADFPWFLAKSYFRSAYEHYTKALEALWNRPYAGYNPNGIDSTYSAKRYIDMTYLCIELQKKYGGTTGQTLSHYKGINPDHISEQVKKQVIELLRVYGTRMLVDTNVPAIKIDDRRRAFLADEQSTFMLAHANINLVNEITKLDGTSSDENDLKRLIKKCQVEGGKAVKKVFLTKLREIRPIRGGQGTVLELLKQLAANEIQEDGASTRPSGYI